jgi:L-asparaginase II
MTSFLANQPVVAEVVRNGLVESVHHGIVVGLDAEGDVALQIGDPTGLIYPRSASKPIQAVAMLRSGIDLDGELLALAAASHSGEEFHVDGARRILASVGLDESSLQCPPALPMEPDDLMRYVRGGGEPDPIHMNCSGKHAAMLATCVVNGWPTETYTDPEHPLQVVIHETLEEFSGEKITQVAIDGCGAPLFGFSLLGLARAFRAVALGAEDTAEWKVANSFRQHPEWTSGTHRDETRLMRAVPGLVNKAGADGVDALALPDGRTVAIKITDGNPRARRPVVVAALRRLGVTEADLDPLATTPVLGGGAEVGEIRAVI